MLLHALQNLPQHSYTKHEFEKFVTLSDSVEYTYAFKVEVTIIHKVAYSIFILLLLNKEPSIHVKANAMFQLCDLHVF